MQIIGTLTKLYLSLRQNKRMGKKKKIILIILSALIGAYFLFWLSAQIYTYYNPPVAGDVHMTAKKYQEAREKHGIWRW
jgi:hypothetical protein